MNLKNAIILISRYTLSSGQYVKNFLKPPTSLNGYYTVGKFMVAKKLVKAIFLVLSILSAVYLILVLPEKIDGWLSNKGSNKIYTKYCTSRALKKYSGVAKVMSKKSKAQYVGDIVNGVANGKGTLFDKNGNIVYYGDFVNNEYFGEGNLYHKNGNIKYIGILQNNKYNGLGKLYYENGKINYDGEFVQDLKSGKGTLYNDVGGEIFKGDFFNDKPAIDTFIGGKIKDVRSSFLENEIMYTYNDEVCLIYKNLGVMVFSENKNNSFNDEGIIDKIYILDNKYFGDGPRLERDLLDKMYDKLEGIKKYTGYTRVQFPEMSVLDYLKKSGEIDFENLPNYEFENTYTDILEVKNCNSNDKLYVQSYEYNNLEYTFYFNYKDEKYVFYSIERLN